MIVPTQPSFVWQPTLWLHTRLTDDYVLQYEGDWLDTSGYSNVVLEIIKYGGETHTELAIEGCDTPDGGWSQVLAITGDRLGSFIVPLTTARSRSDPRNRLWKILRWRWEGVGAGPIAPYDICFKIRAICKP